MREPEYVSVEIVACRLEGVEGWWLGENQGGSKAFTARLEASRAAIVETRLVMAGLTRAGAKEDDGYLSPINRAMAVSQGWMWDEGDCCWRSPGELPSPPAGEPCQGDDVSVTFHAAEVGWQPVTISAGGRTTSFEANHVYDPFPDIIGWLETICRRQQWGRVSADLVAGPVLGLLALPSPDPARVRIIVSYSPGRNGACCDVELDVDVDRRRFVTVFYRALRAYAESDCYVVDHWGSLTLREDLARRGQSVNPAELARWDAQRIGEWLDKTYQSEAPRPDHPDAAGAGSSPRLTSLNHLPWASPSSFMPEEFDAWDEYKRRIYIDDILGEVLMFYDGADLKLLKSAAIELYIA